MSLVGVDLSFCLPDWWKAGSQQLSLDSIFCLQLSASQPGMGAAFFSRFPPTSSRRFGPCPALVLVHLDLVPSPRAAHSQPHFCFSVVALSRPLLAKDDVTGHGRARAAPEGPASMSGSPHGDRGAGRVSESARCSPPPGQPGFSLSLHTPWSSGPALSHSAAQSEAGAGAGAGEPTATPGSK